jgi:hypothetical protein
VIKHIKGEIFKRAVTKGNRAEAKIVLKKMKPKKFRTKLIESADPELMNLGNFDDIQQIHTWKKIRNQVIIQFKSIE